MYTLAVEDVVDVPVKFTLKSKGVDKKFAFTLTASRISQEDINVRLEKKEGLVKDFLKDVLNGWSGQRLVLDDQGEPAAFSAEALDVMLDVAGVGTVIFGAYFKECGAKEKN